MFEDLWGPARSLFTVSPREFGQNDEQLRAYGQGLLGFPPYARPPQGPTQFAGIPGTVGGVPRGQLPAIGPTMQQVHGGAAPQMSGVEAGEQPGFMDRLGSGINNNWATLVGLGAGIAQGGIGPGLQGAMKGSQIDKANRDQLVTTKAIFDGLIAKGKSPQEAMSIATAASRNEKVAAAILPEALGTLKPSGTFKIGDLELPFRYGAGGQPELSLPGGKGVSSLQDLIDFQQQNAARGAGLKSAEEEAGKVRGTARANLGAARIDSTETIRLADQLLVDPALKNVVGKPFAEIERNYPPGTPEWAFKNLENQVIARSFTQAYETLKGGGQITEFESKSAAAALQRIRTSLDEKSYRAAIEDFKRAVKQGYAKLQAKAGGGGAGKISDDPLGLNQ